MLDRHAHSHGRAGMDRLRDAYAAWPEFYFLRYQYVPEIMEKRGPHRPKHLELAAAALKEVSQLHVQAQRAGLIALISGPCVASCIAALRSLEPQCQNHHVQVFNASSVCLVTDCFQHVVFSDSARARGGGHWRSRVVMHGGSNGGGGGGGGAWSSWWWPLTVACGDALVVAVVVVAVVVAAVVVRGARGGGH
jgi:hypothetical protein